jgi:tetratricopeptide (TPR) repeat protein
MRIATAALLSALASSAAAQDRFEPPPFPPGCTSPSAPCPLLDFTRSALSPALGGVTLTPAQGQPNLFLATTTDRTLPSFRLMWIEERSISPDWASSNFQRGLQQPGRLCVSRPLGQPTRTGQSFAINCAGGTSPEIQVFFHAAQGTQRTAVLVLLAPLQNGPALLALGGRMAAALAGGPAAPPVAQTPPAYVAPPHYAQLRADCADPSDVGRQIAGCDAVLANPSEQNNYGIATNNRGAAYERSGDFVRARAEYERAVALDPSYIIAQINRARMLAHAGRHDEALQAFDRVIAREDGGWARLERGRVHAARNDLARALADLDEAVRLMPGDAEAVGERDRVRTAQAAAPPPVSAPRNPMESAILGQTLARPYVGAALLRAPLGPLPGGDALLAYTRELLAPAFTNLTLRALSNPLAFSGEAPGLPRLTLRWWDFQDSSSAEIQIDAFGRELNGGCQVRRMLAERPGQDAYAAIYGTVCPTLDPPYHLWWLTAKDRDRSRLLLVAAPTADAAALQAAGDGMLAALGMLRTGAAPSAPVVAAPSPAAQPHRVAPAGPDLGGLAEAFLRLRTGGSANAAPHDLQRPAANVASIRTAAAGSMPAGRNVVTAESCSRVIERIVLDGSTDPVDYETIYDLAAVRRLFSREDRSIRVQVGVYGSLQTRSQAAVPLAIEAPNLLREGANSHRWFDRLLQLAERFCGGG